MNILLGIIFLINICTFTPDFPNKSETGQPENPSSMEKN